MALLVLFVSSSAISWGLEPERALTQAMLRKWQAPQGLPQATVLCMLQSADGRLWLGTQSGLYLFDGLRFQPCTVKSGISLQDVWIEKICQSSDGALWLATNGSGVIRYLGEHAEIPSRLSILEHAIVHSLMIDRHQTLWIGTDSGLHSYDGNNCSYHGLEEGLELGRIFAITESSDGLIWVGGEGNRVFTGYGKRFVAREFNSLPPETIVSDLLAAPDNAVWVGSTHGLVEIQGTREKLLTRANGLADDMIECLARSDDGCVWVGTRDGISRIIGREIESFRLRDGLTQSTACSLLVDAGGCLWVGTKNGLNQFVDRRTLPFTESEGLGSNETGPILQDRDGNIWIGTIGAGLSQFDGRRCSVALTTAEGLPSDRIFSLAAGEGSALWIGTDEGLCLVEDGKVTKIYRAADGLPTNFIQCLITDHTGTLWIGTSQGLAQLKDGQMTRFAESDPSLQKPILAMLLDTDGSMIVALERGVYRCTDQGTKPILGDGQPLQSVDSLIRTNDGRLWMGTRDHGLYLLNSDGSSFRFLIKHGLYDDEIYGIVTDEEDRLWLACSRGIFFVALKDLISCSLGQIPRVESRPFSPSEALRTVECQRGVQPSSVLMRDNRLWFSTNHGVITIAAQQLNRKPAPPGVFVEEMLANGNHVSLQAPIRLAPGAANLAFRYSATNYVIPQRMLFRYKLDGFDADWIDAGARREAFYTNLPPNSYRFRVMALQPGGEWIESPQAVAFVVPHLFYQTRWFLIATAGMIALLAWGTYRLRMLQLRSQFQAVIAERLRIARELHDTLIQGFSGVTMQMQALSNRLTPSPERVTLKEVIADAGFCLREARRTVAGLRNAQGSARLPDAITQAARQAAESHDIQLRLQIDDVPPTLPMEVEYHVLRIAQEAILNTIKHSGARHLEVKLQVRQRRLILSVIDDGRGFQINGSEVQSPGHYGLIGIRERTLQIQGLLDLQSKPGQGTSVVIEVPMPTANPVTPSWNTDLTEKDDVLG